MSEAEETARLACFVVVIAMESAILIWLAIDSKIAADPAEVSAIDFDEEFIWLR